MANKLSWQIWKNTSTSANEQKSPDGKSTKCWRYFNERKRPWNFPWRSPWRLVSFISGAAILVSFCGSKVRFLVWMICKTKNRPKPKTYRKRTVSVSDIQIRNQIIWWCRFIQKKPPGNGWCDYRTFIWVCRLVPIRIVNCLKRNIFKEPKLANLMKYHPQVAACCYHQAGVSALTAGFTLCFHWINDLFFAGRKSEDLLGGCLTQIFTTKKTYSLLYQTKGQVSESHVGPQRKYFSTCLKTMKYHQLKTT